MAFDTFLDTFDSSKASLEENADVKRLVKNIHNYYRGIIDHLPSNVYWLDSNCQGVGCNLNVLKTLQLNSMDEFFGIDFATMTKKAQWTEGQGEKFLEDTKEVIRTGIAKYHIEEPPIPDANGNHIYFLTSRVPLFKDDKVIGVVGISVDITYQKQVEKDLLQKKAELEKANTARKFFIANMSHDMRTLLSGIVSISELLPSYKDNPAQTDEMYDILQTASKKLLDMVNEILKLSEQGKTRINLKKENITRIFYEASAFLQASFEEKKLPLIINITDDLPDIVLCDSMAITRIVNNLLGNALKYTHKGCVKFTVKLIQQDNKPWIKVVVEDTGIGIPADKLDAIFDPFSRLHQTDSSVYEGLGIGLSVVKTLIKSLGGSIEVSSQLNKGSQFTWLLPIIEEKEKE